MKRIFFMLTSFVLMFSIVGNMGTTATAAEQKDDFAITVLNESTMRLELLNEDAKIDKDEAGTLTIKKGEYVEVLPTQTMDINGNIVDLIYKLTDNGVIIELHKQSSNTVMVMASSKWKCTLGVLGGYYSGALAGLGAGAAAGTVVPGVGNVAGAVGGTIIGAASGAMIGASSSCF